MNNLIISIFGNKIFFEILNELKSFSNCKLNFFDDLNSSNENTLKNSHLAIFFLETLSKKDYLNLIKIHMPIIFVSNNSSNKILLGEFYEQIYVPFDIKDLEKKIVSILAKFQFNKRSEINLGDYVINKNERSIKKNSIELKLTEKEISFLFLFTQNFDYVTRNFVLKNVWKYSSESDTHTIETHIHRLRKKILEKFGDKNFIKTGNKGYFI